MGRGSEVALKNRIVSISWKTWTEGRKKEKLPYEEFYKKYDYLKDSHVWKNIVEVTDELNLGSSDGRTIRDSSGNGNKGILIGDFKIQKEDRDIPIRRDTVMKTPKKGTENGAI